MTADLQTNPQQVVTSVQEKALVSKPHFIQYDLVRAVAMTWVIIEHSLQVIKWGMPGQIWNLSIESIVLTCNVVFFALAGKFALTSQTYKNPKRFYLKRLISVGIPTLVFFFIRTLYDMRGDYVSVRHVVKMFVQNTLGGLVSSDYWFLFTFISLLAVAPFLSLVVHNLTKELQHIFVVLSIVWMSTRLIAQATGFSFGWSYIFADYCIAFMAGTFIEEYLKEIRSSLLFIGALLGSAITCYLEFNNLNAGVYHFSPFYFISGLLYFVVLSRLGTRLKEGGAIQHVVGFIAQHSFTVYLVHYMVLDYLLVHGFPALPGLKSLLIQPVFAFCIFVISLVIATLVDSLLIKPLTRFLTKRISM